MVHFRREVVRIHGNSAAKKQAERGLEKGGAGSEDLGRKYEVADESAGRAYRHCDCGGLEARILGGKLVNLAVVVIIYLLHLPFQTTYSLLLLLMRQLVMVI